MEFNNFADLLVYITEEALILIPVLWLIGVGLKSMEKFPDWMIIWALLGSGVALSFLLLGLTVQAGLQGILVAGVAVLGHQLWKQSKDKRE